MSLVQEPNKSPDFEDQSLQRAWNVLNRNADISVLLELFNGLDQKTRRPKLESDLRLALGFDTNAIFRLGLNDQGANSLDYLSKIHKGPLIVPGQTIQEIWNNFLSGVEPKSKEVAKKLADLEVEMAKIGPELGPEGERVKKSLAELAESHKDWTDPGALSRFDSTIKTLLPVANVPHVPRSEFYQLGRVRKQTKTPPGFRDESSNYGDFFVWADFLYGLCQANLEEVDAVVFVTNDQKPDWSRNGVIHPVLVSEVGSITGKEFRLWTLPMFHAHAKKLVS